MFLVAAVIVMRMMSGEDVWLCQNGEWVAHGKPDGAKPQGTCGAEKAKLDAQEEKAVDQQPEASDTRQMIEGENIRIASPSANSVVSSPVEITGEAKGWYFEGTFPVRLVDDNGNILAKGAAQAKGDWMVDAYVPFELRLNFDPRGTKSGKLIFEKDNPSGLPENARSVSVPVSFGD